MTLRARKALFYGLVALFLVVGTGVVLYAQGWRINLETFQTEKVGAIYIRSYPADAQISINGKPVQNGSGFLSPGTFISNLFPKSYRVTLEAPGYDAWTETAPVMPSMVVQMKYAVLVPNAGTDMATTTGAVKDFFEAVGDVVATEASGSAIVWEGKKIGIGAIVSHSTNLKNFVYRSSANGAYLLYDLTEATTTNLTPALRTLGATAKTITRITIDPYDATSVIVQTPQAIAAIDIANHARTIPIATAPHGTSLQPPLAISSDRFAWNQWNAASGTSRIFVYDKFSGNVTDSSLVIPDSIKELKWIGNGELGIVLQDGSLYRYDVASETLIKIADDVHDFYPTDDGTMLAALESRGVEIFSFTSSDYYRFILPDAGTIQSLAWYRDDAHLFVSYPDRVNFLDLQDAGLHNFATVSPGSAASYDARGNSLYLVNQGGALTRFDFPN